MYIKQMFIILTVLFIGNLITTLTGLPFPASVIALVLLFLALCFKVIKLKDVEDVADFIVNHLALFFVAPSVGMLPYFGLIKESFLQLVIPLLLSIFCGFFAAGKVTELMIRRQEKRQAKLNGEVQR